MNLVEKLCMLDVVLTEADCTLDVIDGDDLRWQYRRTVSVAEGLGRGKVWRVVDITTSSSSAGPSPKWYPGFGSSGSCSRCSRSALSKSGERICCGHAE